MSRRLLVPLTAMVLIATACGGGDDPGEPEPAENPTGEGHTQLSVEAFDFGFRPDGLSVDTGEAVHITFSNTGEAPHTFTSEELGFDVRVDPGGSGEVSFVAPQGDGAFGFRCTIHPDQMQGEVIVGAGGDGGGTKDTDEGPSENDTGVDY